MTIKPKPLKSSKIAPIQSFFTIRWRYISYYNLKYLRAV